MRRNIFILFLLLTKMGKVVFPFLLKFLGLLTKLLKGGSAIKLGLGAATFGAYSVLFDWRFALTVLACIGIHESGHVWAMRRLGMATRGFYFIPLLGGVAVPESAFPNAYTESYVALMGPIWGLFTAAATYGLFLATNHQAYEVAACWMALVNLLNLLPIHPLDGGRVVRSLFRSVRGTASLAFIFCFSLMGMTFSAVNKYWLFVFLGVLGMVDELKERKQADQAKNNGHAREPFDRLLDNLRKILGLPGLAQFDAIQISLQRYGQQSELKADLRKFQELRHDYRAWLKQWIDLAYKWNKKYGIMILNPIPLLVKEDPAENMRSSVDHAFAILSDTAKPDKNLLRYIGYQGAKLREPPESEFQRLENLAKEFRKLCQGMIKVGRPLLNQMVLWLDRLGLAEPKNESGPAPLDDDLEEPEESSEIKLAHCLLGANPFSRIIGEEPMARVLHANCGKRHTYEQWINKRLPLLFLLLIGDQKSRARLGEKYLETRSFEDRAMTMAKSAAMAGVYGILIATFFLLMSQTGGHQAAVGAVKFFKSL
ncbi:site-2 protease family protein [Candidatus Uhrbacteria bacterium]|nr:site-2 protease family protein [Candidatus Uhrbacteria bacterium]